MPRPHATLVVLSSPLRGTAFPISQDMVTIGRSADNAIRIDLGSISRNHVRIERIGDQYLVTDLGSRNGIKVDGRAVREGALRVGSKLTVGDVELELRFAEDVPHEPAAVSPGRAQEAPPITVAPETAAVHTGGGPGETRSITVGDLYQAAAPGTPPAGTETRALPREPEAEAPPTEPAPETDAKPGLSAGVTVAIILVLLGGAAGAVVVYQNLKEGPAVRVMFMDPVKVKVGEKRWALVMGTIGKGPNALRTGRVDFKSDRIVVTDPSVARARSWSRARPGETPTCASPASSTTASSCA